MQSSFMVFELEKYSKLVEIFKKMYKACDENIILLLAQTLLETKVEELNFSTTKTIKSSFDKINNNEEFIYQFVSYLSSRLFKAQIIPFEKYKTIKKRPLTISTFMNYSHKGLDSLYSSLIEQPPKQIDDLLTNNIQDDENC